MRKLHRFLSALFIALTLTGTVHAQQNVIVVDSTPVVKSYTTIVDSLEAHQLEKLKILVDKCLEILAVQPPANPTPEAIAAFETSRQALLTTIITVFPGSGALRVRSTKLVDVYYQSGNLIKIDVALPGTGVGFGFTLNNDTRQRAVDEIEIEGTYAFGPPDVVAQLLTIIRGDNSVAILNQLATLISNVQAQ